MSIAITTWLRAYFALQQRALETRGFTEVITEDEEVIRTPKTVGDDVIAIASVIDPYVRAQPENFGVYAFGRRWQACIDDLEYNAPVSPRSEYAENQSFWETLPHICVYLHGQGAELPPAEVWEALLDELGGELRNAGPKGDGPFKHFDVNGSTSYTRRSSNTCGSFAVRTTRMPSPEWSVRGARSRGRRTRM